MLEGRRAQFIEELMQQDATRAEGQREVDLSIDRLVYYAGWCDKFQQIFSSVEIQWLLQELTFRFLNRWV